MRKIKGLTRNSVMLDCSIRYSEIWTERFISRYRLVSVFDSIVKNSEWNSDLVRMGYYVERFLARSDGSGSVKGEL